MTLQIKLLNASDNVLSAFRDDGWKLTVEQQGRIVAKHPRVRDQAAARERLLDLGLLTSRSLRIDFEEVPKDRRSSAAV